MMGLALCLQGLLCLIVCISILHLIWQWYLCYSASYFMLTRKEGKQHFRLKRKMLISKRFIELCICLMNKCIWIGDPGCHKFRSSTYTKIAFRIEFGKNKLQLSTQIHLKHGPHVYNFVKNQFVKQSLSYLSFEYQNIKICLFVCALWVEKKRKKRRKERK